MIIQHHVIKDEQIIGISPLMLKRKTDFMSPSATYYYDLYTRSNIIRIQLNEINYQPSGNGWEMSEVDQKSADAFVQEFNDARIRVAELIEETLPSNQKEVTT